MGYNNWNAFHNRINSSLFLDTATFMKQNGLLDAGYNYVTLGGIGYAEGATWNATSHGWGPLGPGNITRNATGYLQCDPVRFPGGNEGMRKLTDSIREMGFKWGHYTESGTSGCNGAHGSSEGYEDQDAKLFFGDFKSEYLMVDSCGIEARPPPQGPPADWPECPSDAPGCGPRAAQAQWEMTKWRDLIDTAVANGHPPIVLHDCHNGCGSPFGGPTLGVVECDASDTAQHWSLPTDGSLGALIDGATGLCVGCASSPVPDNHRGVGGTQCGNDAQSSATGGGFGMQACLTSSYDNGATDGKPIQQQGMGSQQQLWNFSAVDGTIRQLCRSNDMGCMVSPPCLALVNGTGPAVISTRDPEICDSDAARWTSKATTTTSAAATGQQFVTKVAAPGGKGHCLTSAGKIVIAPVDPWCIQNNNMWRSNTDVLQVWTRIMVEVESTSVSVEHFPNRVFLEMAKTYATTMSSSERTLYTQLFVRAGMANQGHISRPGAWSFPDVSACLQPY